MAIVNKNLIFSLCLYTLTAHGESVRTSLVVVGGATASVLTPTVEAYDLSTPSSVWRRLADFTRPLSGIAATTLNGVVYAAGGFADGKSTVAETFSYDPSSNIWTREADMRTSRAFHSLLAFEGRIYAVGGFTNSGGPWSPIVRPEVEVFDPKTRSWRPLANMTEARSHFGLAALGGYLYAFYGNNGSFDPLGSVERYDPKSDQWSSLVTTPKRPRFSHTVAVVGQKIYVIGGYAMDGEADEALSLVEAYDVDRNAWADVAPLPGINGRYGARAVGFNGRVYVVGGAFEDAHGYSITVLSSIAVYDPESDSWSLLTANMSIGRASPAVALLVSPAESSSATPSRVSMIFFFLIFFCLL